jgi:5'-deoxynucleotidase YfbR-like HD superfamily hydrolase
LELFNFALKIGKLKKLRRTGWVRYGIPDSESVAEHIFRLSTLTMFLAGKVGVDPDKSLKMAIIHDLGEATIGDIVTRRGKNILPIKKRKLKKERIALEVILSLVDAQEYTVLFDEYEEQQTIEAQFVYQLDKLEMAIQAYEYEKEHNIDLDEFFESAHSVVQDKHLVEILDDIEKLRK